MSHDLVLIAERLIRLSKEVGRANSPSNILLDSRVWDCPRGKRVLETLKSSPGHIDEVAQVLLRTGWKLNEVIPAQQGA